ncbi:hypothetical protein MIND_00826900 [Mycena indigotica]|uniref:Uncharacterized protein n=1 Tax=Mycena indigotica TaxID=2126181 RepID=A0A8H6SH00_9AGAR|nr:uncharacterized protein MIND_00826900 [Mycena indigotica]KAF7298793.1 hypothetical protein MIND_00826900 [Mycena indigotica]
MKLGFSILVTTLGAATSVMGQSSRIGAPVAGAHIKLGGTFTVQVIRNNGLLSSTEVGMVICLLSCPTSSSVTCPSPQGQLGDCIYTGLFNPTIPLETGGGRYENFTLTAPSTENFFVSGRAQLAVARLHLIGAGPAPVLELNNITVVMVN